MSDYATFLKIGSDYQPISQAETLPQLPKGIYTVKFDPRNDMIAFSEAKTTHDKLVDLPGTAYDTVVSDFEWFLTSECKARFQEVELLHKMNILLYGVPGGGKTCIVNRVAYRVIQENGVVLFNPDPRAVPGIFKIFDKLQPDTKLLIIFEEIDELIRNNGDGAFLHILDGEIQKANAMFIATTNYIDKIPARVRRPGRFPVRLEVGLPSYEARLYYCGLKLKDVELVKTIAQLTENFTIDQLKEVIRAHYCMRKDLNAVIADLRKEFGITASGQSKPSVIEAEEFDPDWNDEEEEVVNMLMNMDVGKSRD